jgi:three-Cys-motif partner protein
MRNVSKPKYCWKVGQTPPVLDRHSVAKHNVLREYLKLYVSVLTANPRRDHLRLTLIDGFCGGGMYRGPLDEVRPGSPLIMLEAMAAAETLAKASRRKEFSLAADFFFIDEDESACEHLRHILAQSVHRNQAIKVLHGGFESYVQTLIDHIKSRGRAHRCIFVLDQYGYKDTPLPLLRSIFRQLPHAEVLLTFATDSLIDYLGNNPESQQRLDQLGFGLSVADIEAAKCAEPHHWRRMIQVDLHHGIHVGSGAKHYTPFFIRCPQAHRSYWLIHLSNHHRARDVMTSLHWSQSNDFVHYGGAGLQMLGYDWRQDAAETGQPMIDEFRFDDDAEQRTRSALLVDVPKRLAFVGRDGITFDDFFAGTTNETPATSSILRHVMGQLSQEGEIDVFGRDGKLRRPGSVVENADRLKFSRQIRLLPTASSHAS